MCHNDRASSARVGSAQSVYHIPNLTNEVAVAKTQQPPSTAVRGPGLVQAIAITEVRSPWTSKSLSAHLH